MPATESIQKFVEAFLEFEKQARGNTRLSVLFSRGMELFCSLPGGQFSTLFLLNEENFELEHSHTYPSDQKSASKLLYTQLLEEKVIGKALSFGTIQTYEVEEEAFDLCVLIPVISTQTAVGLIVLSTKGQKEHYNDDSITLINGVAIAFANIFSAKRLNSKLERSKEILDQKVASRTIEISESRKDLFERFESFRSSISMSIPHEVRTPLNHILGFSDYLLSSTGDISSEDNKEIISDIRDAGRNLHHLFEHYIFYNRLNMAASNIEELQKLQSQVVYSSKAFLESMLVSETLITDRKADLLVDLDDAPVAISDDHLKKIVEELLSNAEKYSEPGTAIKITSQPIGDSLVITVEDSGRGMTKEQSNHIEAFVQFDRDTYEQQGLGLGMAIVTRIIDIYNGSIKVKSQLNTGTAVTVELPLALVK